MRGLSLASRASPAIKNLSEEAYNHRKFNKENPTKRKPKAALNPRPTDKLATPSRGRKRWGGESEFPQILYLFYRIGLLPDCDFWFMSLCCFSKLLALKTDPATMIHDFLMFYLLHSWNQVIIAWIGLLP
ncbi:unnamed protein product, partial [Vitis vinifera]